MKLMLEFVDLDLFASKSDGERFSVLCAAVACEPETHIERLLQSGVPEVFHLQGYLDDSHSCPIYCGPLELAARTGNEKLVSRLLVGKTARRSSQGYGSPLNDSLRMAIYGGHEHIVKLLLDHGAEPDCRDHSACLPLNIAIVHESIFKPLLERGAAPKSENEVYPFHTEVMEAVIKAGKATLVQELLDCDVPIERTGLIYHVLDGGAPMLEFFLTKGLLKLPVRKRDREVIISYAVKNGRLSSLKYLLDHNYKMPAQKVPKMPAYLADTACNVGDDGAVAVEVFNTLLSRGVNINSRTRPGEPALLYGIVRYGTRCIKYLLNYGANPLAPDPKKRADQTLLSRTYGEALEAMLQAIDIHAVSRSQLQSDLSKQLDIAARLGHWKFVKKLERFQARVNIELGAR